MNSEAKSIAIVEDEAEEAERLRQYLGDFTRETGTEFNVTVFPNAVDFLTDYAPRYDIILMDINMPMMDGMRAAHKLRELDNVTTLIFVTNVARLAVKGYEVRAFEYIVKPISYYDFALKLRRALQYAATLREVKIAIPTETGCRFVTASSIRYVEIMKHRIVYHTAEGDFVAYGTLKKVEQSLGSDKFVRCNSCYLVNLRDVSGIEGSDLILSDGVRLAISRQKRADLMKALNKYYGSGGLADV